MNTNVIEALADYFGTHPKQVQAWDQKVVSNLSSDTSLFRSFLTGCERTKWTIYAQAKFGEGNAPDLRPITKNPGSHQFLYRLNATRNT